MARQKNIKSIITRSLIAIAVLITSVMGIAAGLTLTQRTVENRSSASVSSGTRTGWLGIASDWQSLQTRPQDAINRVGTLGSPWVYNWTANRNLYESFGDAATPMYWNCSNGDPTATFNTLLNWPTQKNTGSYYVMFLNEPDDSHALCSPQLAAKQLNQFLKMRADQKRSGVKVLLGGGVHSTEWLKSTLATYRTQYGSNPDIAGIHVHIYADQGQPTVAKLLESLKGQLQNWRSFTTTGDNRWLAQKEFWISETGVLSATIPASTVASMLTGWTDYLATQAYVTRVFWFMDTVQSDFAFTWQFRSSALYQDENPNTPVLNAFKSACSKYCPRVSYPPLPAKPTTNELQTVVLKKKLSGGKYKTRWVTPVSQPNTTFTTRDPARTAPDEVVGRMYKTPGSGRLAVHECYIKIWDDYALATATTDTRPKDFCSKKEELYKGVVGYVSAGKSTAATLPMQECFDTTNQNHYYITNDNCASYTNTLTPKATATKSWLYGWLAPSVTATTQGAGATTPPATARPLPTATPNNELLTVYEQKKTSTTGKKTRWTTPLSQADPTLTGTTIVGRLYKNPGVGRKAVHECYFHDWDDYIMTVSDSATRPTSFCSNTTANWRETYKGVIGYAAASKSTITPVAIQGCWDATNLNHAYTTKEGDCSPYINSISPKPIVTKEWLYGWMAN